MTTYYAADVRIEVEESGIGEYGKTRYRGTVQLPDGASWGFTDLEAHGGELCAAEAALAFATFYNSENRSEDVPATYPSAALADRFEAAAVDALASDTLPVGIERGENTDPKGGQIFVGDMYVVADSPEAFARFVARENARFLREESEAKRAEIKRREEAGEVILPIGHPDCPWSEVVRLDGEENAAREAAGLGKRKEHTAWPGGYPIIYVDACEGRGTCPDNDPGSVLCSDCATDHEDKGGKVAPDVHYEGAPEECSSCGREIASAYGDPEKEDRK